MRRASRHSPRGSASGRVNSSGGLRFLETSSTLPAAASTATASQSRGPSAQRARIDHAGFNVPSCNAAGSSNTCRMKSRRRPPLSPVSATSR